MAKCDCCGKDTGIPFDCPYCGGSFCSDHRLPPSHHCPNEEYWRARKAPAAAVPPMDTGPSLPEKACSYPGCGEKTARVFYCPACGQEFCETHRLHRDHAPGSSPAAGPAQSTIPPQPAPQPKVTVDRYAIAAILIVLLIVVGGIVIAGKLIQGGAGTTTAPGTTACWTQGTARTTASPVPALSPAATTRQYVTVVIPLPSPAESVTGVTPADGPASTPATPAPTTTTTTTERAATAPPATVPAAPASGATGIRPATGTIVAGKSLSGGQGEMTIGNAGGSTDVVAILTQYGQKKTLVAVYIRKGDSFSLGKIADGRYDLYVHAGSGWDPAAKRFAKAADYWKFEDPVSFTTTERVVGSVRYLQPTHWTMVIYPSMTGNAASEPVPEEDFPGL